ncbi:MAG: NAD(P)-binding protein, partial [Spirochaetota bacterium]
MEKHNVVIVGSGPAGLGAAFRLAQAGIKDILLLEQRKMSSGGLRNDCKQNYTFPVGFSTEYWGRDEANDCLLQVEKILQPRIETNQNMDIYTKRARRLGVELLDIRQAHVGTDKSAGLITSLI